MNEALLCLIAVVSIVCAIGMAAIFLPTFDPIPAASCR